MSGTITSVIQMNASLPITHSKLSFRVKFTKSNGDEVIANYGSVIDKYLPLLKQQYTISWEMTPEEFQEFRYQPKKISNYLYGTTELWSALMNINQIYSVSQFNKRKILVFREDVFNVIDEIMIREEAELEHEVREMK